MEGKPALITFILFFIVLEVSLMTGIYNDSVLQSQIGTPNNLPNISVSNQSQYLNSTLYLGGSEQITTQSAGTMFFNLLTFRVPLFSEVAIIGFIVSTINWLLIVFLIMMIIDTIFGNR